ncbi:MAG TPA: LysR family transcriptional regulator [Rhodocyclaceae bacterium]|jgi:DNA-binding transcriptional LysR family regulator|nr:LysR family transcriptional regulator [Rhodocyclaceae bacterium]
MSELAHISLEQWRALVTVVEAGGYAQAAEVLFKSQSAVTYAVQKIEQQLGVKAFELQGRKAVLTPTGHMLYRRALALVTEAAELEKAARTLSAGWEAEIGLAVEILFPTWLLIDCLAAFGEESPQTRVEVIESVLGGTPEALLKGQAELAISPRVPPGFAGDPLMTMEVVAVAAPNHPLHQLGRELTYRDLKNHRHLTVRDTGANRDRKALSVEVERRWTVSHLATAIEAVKGGHGFSWFPLERIRDELAAGILKPLPLREGLEKKVELYLILADPDFAGPGVRRLAEIIRAQVKAACKKRQARKE